MKRLLIALCAISVIACQQESKVEYSLISGKIENSKASVVTLSSGDFKKEMPLSKEGTFSDTLHIPEKGFYSLSIGRESTNLYLKKGDDINVTINAKEFDESINYTGTSGAENNYLAKKYLNNEAALNDAIAFYSLDEGAYKERLKQMKAANLDALNAMEDAHADFVVTEKNNLLFDEYSMINKYERYHAHYAKKPDFKVSDSFVPEALKTMTFDDEQAYKSSASYRDLAISNTLDPIYESIGDDYLATTIKHLKPIEDIKIQALKNDVISNLGGFLVSPGNENMEAIYKFFINSTTDEKMKSRLTEKFEKNKDLMRGKPSPQFVKYENHKGGDMSLADLKGKYVYVDVWATWCGPCIREIPSLKEVEKQFHNENIAFVSTSIDEAKNHDKWTSMVNDKNLGGVQLLADKDWNSKFVRDYAIDGIPRFILIDPNGNIVSADAPRPSSPKLVELLEEELKMKP